MSRAGWFTLTPETWRRDLLQIVLRACASFGTIVCVPSVFLAVKVGNTPVAVMDIAAIATVLALAYFDRMPAKLRAACACLVMYALGSGLMIQVGSISQIYLLWFSLLTTLLLDFRWGVASVVLNTATMLTIGFVGIASPEMVVPRWTPSFGGWSVITTNFVLVNGSLVLALGAVIRVLEGALLRAVTARGVQAEVNRVLAQEIHERTRVEESLQESRALLRIAGKSARLGGWRVAARGDHVEWSDEVCEIHEVAVGTAPTLAEAIAFYASEFRARMSQAMQQCIDDGIPFDLEALIVTATSRRRWVRIVGDALRDAAGAITHIHGSIQDITPQKLAQERHDNLEEQLRQAQKMETLGSLAGGVAHDFNNLMSVVLSYSEMISDDLQPSDPARLDLEEIRSAALRAVGLTRQLLAFSRQQVLAPKVVDLSSIVAGTENMLRRLIGEDVELATSCAAGLGKVRVDPGQIEQVIMNLAVNARDAMPQGGMLTIETARAELGEQHASEHVGVTPGHHVMLSVSDTGQGMDKATQSRMFDPFFTTKERGKGTGLGLATVFGIVEQSGGTIWVYSEVGRGTTFKIYFPIVEEAATAHLAPPPAASAIRGGSETILLVEDEDAVRALSRTILMQRGYKVIDAQNGDAALLLCQHDPQPIDLLLTDVVMPRMSGRELAERLLPIRPQMKVLYMSGYTDDAVVRHGILDATISFIQKPITPGPLARRVREVLDGER